ncbi:MAG: phage terminase small subunit [Victivallaceae bacterium]|nr:phage terminase small subunit [Victivallaceae bacterium]
MGMARQYHEMMMRREAEEAAAKRLAEGGAAAMKAAGDSAFTLLVDALAAARNTVHAAPQGEARVALKRKFLAEFMPAVEDYLATGKVYANPVLIWCMVWSFDVGDAATGIRLAEAAIAQHQKLTAPFQNDYTVARFAADAVLEWAQAQVKAGSSAEPYFTRFLDKVLSGALAVHDIVKAKYCKLAAQIHAAAGNPAPALEYARRAQELGGDKAQVKTLISALEKTVAEKAEASRYEQKNDNPDDEPEEQ